MTEKPEEVKLATPIYTRNAKKRYYEKKKQDPGIYGKTCRKIPTMEN